MRKIFLLFFLFSSILFGEKFPAQNIAVIDGDTIYAWVESFGNIKVRLIGIDAPELEIGRHGLRQAKRFHILPYRISMLGWEAKLALQSLLPKGSHFTLETDVEIYDPYGRLLGYVWKGGKLINEEMILMGYATVYTFPPNVKYVERFISAQKIAQQNRRGIWKFYRFRHF